MQIPSLISATAQAMSDTLRSRTAPDTQGEAVSGTPSVEQAVASISLLGIGLSKPQGAPGMSSDQLSSMLQTTLKMQAIRNDASIPAEVKKKLLMPLEKANRDVMAVADAKAEQEEKTKILEASAEDAQAIREAGEEIAASLEENAQPPAQPGSAAGSEALADPAVESAEKAATNPPSQPAASAYTAAPNAPAVGQNVDTRS